MQALIPSSSNGASKGISNPDEPNGGGGDAADSPEMGADGKETKESIAKSNSSKAATVESANKYIRQLKDMDAVQKAAMMQLKRENDEMKRRLQELTGGGAAAGSFNGSSSSCKDSPALAVDPGPDDTLTDRMDESRSPQAVEA